MSLNLFEAFATEFAKALKTQADAGQTFDFTDATVINSFISTAQTALVNAGTITAAESASINTTAGSTIAAQNTQVQAATSTSFAAANVSTSLSDLEVHQSPNPVSISVNSSVSDTLPEIAIDGSTASVTLPASVGASQISAIPDVAFENLSVSATGIIGVSLPEITFSIPSVSIDNGAYNEPGYVNFDYVEGDVQFIPTGFPLIPNIATEPPIVSVKAHVSVGVNATEIEFTAPTSTFALVSSVGTSVPEMVVTDIAAGLGLTASATVSIPSVALVPSSTSGGGVVHDLATVPSVALHPPESTIAVSLPIALTTVGIPELALDDITASLSVGASVVVSETSITPVSVRINDIPTIELVGMESALAGTEVFEVLVSLPDISFTPPTVTPSSVVSVVVTISDVPLIALDGSIAVSVAMTQNIAMGSVALVPAEAALASGSAITHIGLLRCATEPPIASVSAIQNRTATVSLPSISTQLPIITAGPTTEEVVSIPNVSFISPTTIPLIGNNVSANVVLPNIATNQIATNVTLDSSANASFIEQIVETPSASASSSLSVQVSIPELALSNPVSSVNCSQSLTPTVSDLALTVNPALLAVSSTIGVIHPEIASDPLAASAQAHASFETQNPEISLQPQSSAVTSESNVLLLGPHIALTVPEIIVSVNSTIGVSHPELHFEVPVATGGVSNSATIFPSGALPNNNTVAFEPPTCSAEGQTTQIGNIDLPSVALTPPAVTPRFYSQQTTDSDLTFHLYASDGYPVVSNKPTITVNEDQELLWASQGRYFLLRGIKLTHNLAVDFFDIEMYAVDSEGVIAASPMVTQRMGQSPSSSNAEFRGTASFTELTNNTFTVVTPGHVSPTSWTDSNTDNTPVLHKAVFTPSGVTFTEILHDTTIEKRAVRFEYHANFALYVWSSLEHHNTLGYDTYHIRTFTNTGVASTQVTTENNLTNFRNSYIYNTSAYTNWVAGNYAHDFTGYKTVIGTATAVSIIDSLSLLDVDLSIPTITEPLPLRVNIELPNIALFPISATEILPADIHVTLPELALATVSATALRFKEEIVSLPNIVISNPISFGRVEVTSSLQGQTPSVIPEIAFDDIVFTLNVPNPTEIDIPSIVITVPTVAIETHSSFHFGTNNIPFSFIEFDTIDGYGYVFVGELNRERTIFAENRSDEKVIIAEAEIRTLVADSYDRTLEAE